MFEISLRYTEITIYLNYDRLLISFQSRHMVTYSRYVNFNRTASSNDCFEYTHYNTVIQFAIIKYVALTHKYL